MEYRIYNNALELVKVVETVRDFFEKNGFQVSVISDNAFSHTIVSKSLQDVLLPKIVVNVCRKNDFLSVSFLNSDDLHSKMFLSSIFGLFGGNLFLLKKSAVKEKIERLEEAFWKYLEINFRLSPLP